MVFVCSSFVNLPLNLASFENGLIDVVFISCHIEDDEDNLDADVVEQAAEMVYGLIHMRFVLTNTGIVKMVIYQLLEQRLLGYFLLL